jgi:hypothetical protein
MMPVPVPLYDVRSQKLREKIREQTHHSVPVTTPEPKSVILQSKEDYFDIQKLQKQRNYWKRWNSELLEWQDGGLQSCNVVGYVLLTGDQKKKNYTQEIENNTSNFEKIRNSKKKTKGTCLVIPTSQTVSSI